MDFSLTIAPCINLATSSERRYDTFEYVVDEVSPHVLHLPLVERLVPSCTSSRFELTPDQSELPTAFRVSNEAALGQVTISVDPTIDEDSSTQ